MSCPSHQLTIRDKSRLCPELDLWASSLGLLRQQAILVNIKLIGISHILNICRSNLKFETFFILQSKPTVLNKYFPKNQKLNLKPFTNWAIIFFNVGTFLGASFTIYYHTDQHIKHVFRCSLSWSVSKYFGTRVGSSLNDLNHTMSFYCTVVLHDVQRFKKAQLS